MSWFGTMPDERTRRERAYLGTFKKEIQDEKKAKERAKKLAKERSQRELAYLKSVRKEMDYPKKTKKSVRKATKRQREYEELQTKTDVYRDELRVKKAKEELKRKKLQAKGKLPLTTGKKGRVKQPKKIGFFSPYFMGKKIKKKKQGRPLSRKRPIGL